LKKIALATALSLAATSSFAGGFTEPTETEVIVTDTTRTSSSGGIIVPLLLLLVVAAAVASN
jgi:outer membrane cobalamin receptor